MTNGRFIIWAVVSVVAVTLVLGFVFALVGALTGIVVGVAVGLYSKWVLGLANPQTAWFFFLPALVSFAAGALYGAWVGVGLTRSFGPLVRTAEPRQ